MKRIIIIILLLLPIAAAGWGKSMLVTDEPSHPHREMQLIETIYYKNDSYIASAEDRARLVTLIKELRSDRERKLHIKGYSDKWGDVEINNRFAYARAMLIADWMRSCGVYKSQLEYVGMGIDSLATRNADARRVEIFEVFEIHPEPELYKTAEISEKTETAEVIETVDTTEAVELVDTMEAVEEAETAEATENVETAETAETVEKTETVETVETVETAENIETVEIVETTETTESTETAEIVEIVEEIEIETESTESTEKTETIESTSNLSEAVSNPHHFSLRTNMLYWLGGMFNIGAEYRNGDYNIGAIFNGGYSPFGGDGWAHNLGGWFVAPEVRYYIHNHENWFVGAQFFACGYNFKLATTGYQGSILGGGVVGGYTLAINSYLDIDFSLGLGYGSYNYDSYTHINGVNVYKEKAVKGGTLMPVQAGVNLIWRIQ